MTKLVFLPAALVEMHAEDVENVNISQYCKPMPVVEHMRERPGNAYHNPKFTVVHKCNCGRVCENASHRCVAVRSKNVTRLFEVNSKSSSLVSYSIIVRYSPWGRFKRCTMSVCLVHSSWACDLLESESVETSTLMETWPGHE